MRLVSADKLEVDDLAGLFNAAYSDYFVPLRLEPPAFRWMVDVTGVDLAVSRVVLDGDEPVAFALTAVRPPEAWIAGMGTIPGRRRQGLGESALTATVAAARERGAGRVLLEVIDENVSATRLYEKLGFESVRELSVWMLEPRHDEPVAVRPADPAEAKTWIAAHRPSPEPWQRSDPTIERMRAQGLELQAFAVDRHGATAGAVLFQPSTERARIVQIAAGDEPSARDLLSAVASRCRGLRAINMPAGEPAAEALEALGGRVEARQQEMMLRLAPDP